MALLSLASLAAVHYFTFEHPYLLADNRHYTLLCVEEHLQVRVLGGGVGGGSVLLGMCSVWDSYDYFLCVL